MSSLQKLGLVGSVVLLSACATPTEPPDYSAFERHRPQTILVLPPLNNSVDVNAQPAVLSAAVQPLAEAGYYVVPVTNMMETFQQNGMQAADDIHAIAPAKLQEFFGADAALYISVDQYGARYNVLDSVIEVSASAKLVDLHSGEQLWESSVNQVTGKSSSNSLLGRLIGAVVNQISNTLADRAWPASQQAMHTLFRNNRGVLPGSHRDDNQVKP